MIVKKLAIPVNNTTLAAVLHLPEAANPPVVIGSHGLLSTKESGKQITLAKRCTAFGAAYLRLDHRGCGESGGDFLATSLETRVADILAAAAMLRELGLTQRGLALFGSSMGAATSLAAWRPLQAEGYLLKGMVSLAGPVHGNGIAEAAITDQKELHGIPLSFYTENLDFDITPALSAIHHILVVHGDKDEIVSIDNAHTIMEGVQDPKSLIILPGGDHRMSDPDHQALFFTRATAWLEASLFKA